MTDGLDSGDAGEFGHVPSLQRLYHLLLQADDEQVYQSVQKEGSWPNPHPRQAHYPVMAALFADCDELCDLLLEDDPEDATARDYRKRWAALNAGFGEPASRQWWMLPSESRDRSRVLKRFLLRAGPLSLRRKRADDSEGYWSKEALDYQ